MTDARSIQEERRNQGGLRDIFEDAYQLLAPFLDTSNSWDHKPLIRFAMITLHERHPAMKPQDAAILLNAVQRIFAERQSGTKNNQRAG